MALLKAKHEQGRDISNVDTLIELARSIGLETAQIQKDINDNSLLLKLAKDHTFAVETLGIFGTPTLVFPRGKPIFLKLAFPPPSSEGLSVFQEIRCISEQRQYIMEIKRP
jgi:protein-disulfide isomerase-like protein with CxxC motif